MTPQEAQHKQEIEPLFVCSECGEPVIVFAGNFFKTCEHSNSIAVITEAGKKAANYGF